MSLSTNDTNGWASSAAAAVTNTVAGVMPGETITIDIILTIDPSYTGTSIVNYAEISNDDGDDTDSTTDDDPNNDSGGEAGGDTDNTTNNENGDEDDHDPKYVIKASLMPIILK